MVDYHILAERLVNLHTSLHPVPINQELTALNRGTFFALNYLMLHNHSAYPKDLSHSMGVSSARVAALLNHLEKEGFIQRRPDLKDNRQVIVLITDKGIQAICQKRERILDMIARALESLGPEDAQTLLRIQQKLAEKLLFQAQKEISFNTSCRKEADFSTA